LDIKQVSISLYLRLLPVTTGQKSSANLSPREVHIYDWPRPNEYFKNILRQSILSQMQGKSNLQNQFHTKVTFIA